MIIYRIFLILTLILSLEAASKAAFAEDLNIAEKKPKSSKVITTKIRANFIDIKRYDEAIYLNGNVVIDREDMDVLADNMQIYYHENKPVKKTDDEKKDEKKKKDWDEEEGDEEDKKKDKRESEKNKNGGAKIDGIRKIAAQNHVKIFNSEFVATGDIGTYDPLTSSFILEKNVIFNRGSSVAHGEKFIYNLKTKKGNLVGPKAMAKDNNPNRDGRVTVIIDDSDFRKI